MSVVDTRLLGRPSTFGGAEAEWPDWAFSMRAYGAAIDAAFPVAMEAASRAVAPVLVTQLFFMLAMMTKGPALAIVRQAEISGGGPNGLEAWRLLVRRYEPEAATKTLGLLQQILNPVPFPDNVTGFEEALSKWELTISRWESSAHDALNEGVKIALLPKMTPEPLRQNLHLQGHTKYGVARAAVVNALLSQHSWQNAPEPMEVGNSLCLYPSYLGHTRDCVKLLRVRPNAVCIKLHILVTAVTHTQPSGGNRRTSLCKGTRQQCRRARPSGRMLQLETSKEAGPFCIR